MHKGMSQFVLLLSVSCAWATVHRSVRIVVLTFSMNAIAVAAFVCLSSDYHDFMI